MNGCSQAQWENALTPEDAAYQFEWWFERHAGGTQPKRQEKAREYYEKFKGKPLSSFGGSSSEKKGEHKGSN